MTKDTKRTLTLTGAKTYAGHATNRKNLSRGETVTVDDEVAEKLLVLSSFDASNNEHFLFQEGIVKVAPLMPSRSRVARSRPQAAA